MASQTQGISAVTRSKTKCNSLDLLNATNAITTSTPTKNSKTPKTKNDNSKGTPKGTPKRNKGPKRAEDDKDIRGFLFNKGDLDTPARREIIQQDNNVLKLNDLRNNTSPLATSLSLTPSPASNSFFSTSSQVLSASTCDSANTTLEFETSINWNIMEVNVKEDKLQRATAVQTPRKDDMNATPQEARSASLLSNHNIPPSVNASAPSKMTTTISDGPNSVPNSTTLANMNSTTETTQSYLTGPRSSSIEPLPPIPKDGQITQLMSSVQALKRDFNEDKEIRKREFTSRETAIQAVEDVQAEQKKVIEGLKEENVVNKEKISKLTDTVSLLKHQHTELNSRVDALEYDKFRPNLVIQGIDEAEEEKCIEVVQNFFQNKMKITKPIVIKAAKRIGKGVSRLILVTLKYHTDKGIIYKHAKNLQGLTNKFNKAYRIEDQLPAKSRECKKKNRNTLWRNKKTVAQELAISVKKGQIYLGDEMLKSKIVFPDRYKLLRLKADELKELNKISIGEGIQFTSGTSVFKGFVCDAENYDNVNRAYEWVVYNNMDARHVICACILPGSDVTSADFFDNDEYGSGQVLLQLMQESEITDRAIFITRHYDGQHIGKKRFDLIKDAAKAALRSKPFNRVSNAYQFPWNSKKLRQSTSAARGSTSAARGALTGSRRMRRTSEVSSSSSVLSELESEVLLSKMGPDRWDEAPTPSPQQNLSFEVPPPPTKGMDAIRHNNTMQPPSSASSGTSAEQPNIT